MSAATVKHLDPTQVEVEIAISTDELDAARERAFRELVKNVRIRGFRPGKVPRKIFEAQYGKEEIESRALNAVVNVAYSKAIEENSLEPLDRAQLELLPEEDGQPLRARATVSVRPQFEPHDYKGIALEAPAVTVTDADVENALEGLRRDAAILTPVERPVALGDVPTIDYLGQIDGVPFDGGAAEGQATELLEERFIPGFASGIAGMSAGETKEIEARFPDDYSNAELAGKTAVFTVTVHENKVAELPELDDEFAKRFVGEEGTLGRLRDDLRNRLEASARARQRRGLTGVLLEKLSAAHEIALPAVMVDREIESLETETKGYVQQSGVEWAAFLEKQGKSEDELREGYRPEAEKRVKGSLLIEAIARLENIEATPRDIEAEVLQLSRQYSASPETIVEMLGRNRHALVDGIVRTKTVEFLLDHAVVTETAAPASDE